MNPELKAQVLASLDTEAFARAAVEGAKLRAGGSIFPSSSVPSTPMGSFAFPTLDNNATSTAAYRSGTPQHAMGASATTPAAGDAQLQLQPQIELSNTHPLQQVVTSLLRAVVFLSEDVKSLKNESSSLSAMTTDGLNKLRNETARIRRTVEDDYLRKKDYQDINVETLTKVDRMSRSISEWQQDESRGKQILLERIAEQELAANTIQETVASLTKDAVRRSELAALSASQHDKYTSLQDMLLSRILETAQTVDAEKLRSAQLAEKIAGFESGMITTVTSHSAALDALTKKLFQTVESVELEASNFRSQSARIQSDAAKIESNTTSLISSSLRSLQNAVDSKVGDQQLQFERHAAAADARMTNMSHIIDVRIDAVREHVLSLEQELGDIRSEVSVFNSTVNVVGNSNQGRVSSLEERIDAAVQRLEDKQQQFRAKQQEVADQSDRKAQQLLDELSLRIDANARESEKALKLYFSTLQSAHDSNVLDEVYRQVSDQVMSKFDQRLEAELRRVDEKHRRVREKQLEIEGQTEQKAAKILDEITQRVSASQQETERRLRSLVSSNTNTTLSNVTAEVEQRQKHIETELEALRRFCEDSSRRLTADTRRYADDVQRALTLTDQLYDLLCIDRLAVPRDPANFVRFVRSLPWFTGFSPAQPPALLSTLSIARSDIAPHAEGTSYSPYLMPTGGGAQHQQRHPSQPLSHARSISPTSFMAAPAPPPGVVASIASPGLGLEVADWSRGVEVGVEVTATQPNGPAAHSGIRVGDIIIAVSDVHVRNVQEFSKEVRVESEMGRQPRLTLREEGRGSSTHMFV